MERSSKLPRVEPATRRTLVESESPKSQAQIVEVVHRILGFGREREQTGHLSRPAPVEGRPRSSGYRRATEPRSDVRTPL